MTETRPGSGAMFDHIAERYDTLNFLMSLGMDRRWRGRLVRRLELRPGGRLLDLATGTADVAITAALSCRDLAVVGVDPSEQMLAIGREKVAARRLDGRITLTSGDAQALPFEDGTFDAVSIAFGIRNVPDRRRALAEMRRVTRRGGRVGILELTEPGSGILGALARVHVHHVVPLLGRAISSAEEYRYLQTSIAAFPPAEEFAAQMAGVGLEVVAVDRLALGATHVFVGRA